MPYQNIKAKLSNSDKDEIISLLKNIEQKLPFLINLSLEEKRRLAKISDKRLPFAQKVIEAAKQNPELIPQYINIQELIDDFELFNQLKTISLMINSLQEKIADTQTALGNEILTSSLMIYKSFKILSKSNVPGIDSVYENLFGMLKKRNRKKSILS